MTDLDKSYMIDDDVRSEVAKMFNYQPWDEEKIRCGERVRNILQIAYLDIIAWVPPCPDRSAALRKLREARMDCNSAITHEGKY